MTHGFCFLFSLPWTHQLAPAFSFRSPVTTSFLSYPLPCASIILFILDLFLCEILSLLSFSVTVHFALPFLNLTVLSTSLYTQPSALSSYIRAFYRDHLRFLVLLQSDRFQVRLLHSSLAYSLLSAFRLCYFQYFAILVDSSALFLIFLMLYPSLLFITAFAVLFLYSLLLLIAFLFWCYSSFPHAFLALPPLFISYLFVLIYSLFALSV